MKMPTKTSVFKSFGQAGPDDRGASRIEFRKTLDLDRSIHLADGEDATPPCPSVSAAGPNSGLSEALPFDAIPA
jgi:hypothetical protein